MATRAPTPRRSRWTPGGRARGGVSTGLPPHGGLTDAEVDDLTAFLQRGLYDPTLDRYVPAAVPSGQCFPANDAQSRRDLGCDDAARSAR